MELTGKHLIAADFKSAGTEVFDSYDAASGSVLTNKYFEATAAEIDEACKAAAEAFDVYRAKTDAERADFLDAIASEIIALGNELIETAKTETALPEPRLLGERGRTTSQLMLFAKMLREGSWVNAVIDRAQPERQPLPKADIRMMQIPLGPVAVFGASNFPFAFSVAGGDTVSALAAGCPVVFKAHPAHPGTCELVARAIAAAIKHSGMPKGVFNMIQGATHQTGSALVNNPLIQAVGFTGSFRGGKALYDLAVRREQPIPVYAEMGSVNPVFFLPGILKEKGETLAQGLAASVTLGVGQFCTNPGIFVVEENTESQQFIDNATVALKNTTVGSMLTQGIKNAFVEGVRKLGSNEGVRRNTEDIVDGIRPQLFLSDVQTALDNSEILEEVFGPGTVGLIGKSKEDLLRFARALKGQITATVFGTKEDLEHHRDLIDILQLKVGRLIINGFPTGVEVTHAMVHGGPFPATTDSRSTSVGTTAIYRFTRPLCFQDFPDSLLPLALRDGNPLNIMRTIDGETSRH